MKREVIKLVGGLPSVLPTGGIRQMTKNDKVTKWKWSKFNNPARKDDLRLTHWQREEDINKDYEYAQFNKKINIIEFSKEEYEQNLKVIISFLFKDLDLDWTFEETTYLFELCKQYDLRFIVILDRYDADYNRTIEELKNRYYSVARKLLQLRNQHDHPILKSGYTYEQEMKRRACLEKIISRTKEESNEEADLFKQASEIEAKYEKLDKIDKNFKDLSTEASSESFEDYVKAHIGENDSFIYLRTQKLKYPLPISEKIQKKVEVILKEMNIPDKMTPTLRVEQSFDNLRNNIVILTSLKKHLDKKERELSKLTGSILDLQSKIVINRNNISNQTGGMGISVIPDSDIVSVSSQTKDKSKKSNASNVNVENIYVNPNKGKKVKFNINFSVKMLQ